MAVRRDGRAPCAGCRIEDGPGAGLVLIDDACADVTDLRVRGVGASGLVLRDRSRLVARTLVVESAVGNGLLAADSVRVDVTGATLSATAFSAVHLGGDAVARLESVRVDGGEEHGLRVTDAASARVHDAVVSRAALTGFSVDGRAEAVFEDCVTRGEQATSVGIRALYPPAPGAPFRHPRTPCATPVAGQAGTVRGGVFGHVDGCRASRTLG